MALHGHLHGEYPADSMRIDETKLGSLPKLPEVRFAAKVYDGFLSAGGRLPC